VNVTLTGITSIFGKTRALFLVQEPAVPGKPPSTPESYMLTEGERRGILKVLEINEKDGKVKIENDGVASTVTFPKPTPASGPAPGGGPAGPGGPAGMNGGFPRRGGPGGLNPGGGSQIPTRPIRGGGITQDGGGNPNFQNPFANGGGFGGNGNSGFAANGLQGAVGGNANAAAAALNYNGVAVPNTSANSTPTPANQQPALSPEEQMLLIEAQRAYHQQQGDPIATIFPPTALNPASGEESGGGTSLPVPPK
jgi:hypothetical protein